MSILKVARMGHPVLRTRAQPIDRPAIKSAACQRLIDDMMDTMTEYHGVGLAAPQIHESVRLFVVAFDPTQPEPGDDDPTEPFAIINPEITAVGDEMVEDWEGCLSIPDIRGKVPRPKSIKIRAFNREGKRVEMQASGLPARVIMHETDHLDGVLFFDRMKTLDTLTFMDEFGRFWRDDEDDE